MKKQNARYSFPDGSIYPIVEMTKAGVTLYVIPEDVQKGVKRDASACVLAQCALRNGYAKAWISNTVAYLVGWYKGEMVAFKYHVPKETCAALQEFDRTGEFPAEGFLLKPLRYSATREGKKIQNANRVRPWRGNKGEQRPKPYRFMNQPQRIGDVGE